MRATCGIWRVWAALAIALTVCGPARAFYWQDWPGSRLRVQESPIIPPKSQPPVQVPPLLPGRNDLPVGPPITPEKPPVGPHPTPEPSTGLIGLLGLGALAAVRRWRRGAK